MARVLVTGGAGMIGSHLVDQLLEHGHEVAVLDDFSTGTWANLTPAWGGVPNVPPLGPGGYFRAFTLNSKLTVQQGSVTRVPDLAIIADFKPDMVFHLAAQIDVRESVTNPVLDLNTNVLGTLHMLEAARRYGVKRFVFASSAAVYGHANRTVGEGTPYRPISPYGASKAAAEGYVAMYGRAGVWQGAHGADPARDVQASMRCTTVILSNVYGPRQREGFGAVNIFARKLLAGEPVTLYGDGGNTRDYVYVADAVRAFLWAGDCLLGDSKERPARALVGTGRGTTDAELLDLVTREVLNQVGPIVLKSGETPTVLRKEPARPEDIRRMVFPNLGMCGTTLEDGIAVTVQELRKEMGL